MMSKPFTSTYKVVAKTAVSRRAYTKGESYTECELELYFVGEGAFQQGRFPDLAWRCPEDFFEKVRIGDLLTITTGMSA